MAPSVSVLFTGDLTANMFVGVEAADVANIQQDGVPRPRVGGVQLFRGAGLHQRYWGLLSAVSARARQLLGQAAVRPALPENTMTTPPHWRHFTTIVVIVSPVVGGQCPLLPAALAKIAVRANSRTQALTIALCE